MEDSVHTIKIIGGDFRNQNSTISWGTWHISTKDRYMQYKPRAAIKALEKVSENRRNITFKVKFHDEKCLIGSAPRKTYDYLYVQMTSGAKDGDIASKDAGKRRPVLNAIGWCLIILSLAIIGQISKNRRPMVNFSSPNTSSSSTTRTSSFASASCCDLIGMGTACGLSTDYLAQVCGQAIDDSTSFGSSARGDKLSNCMNLAASYTSNSYSSEECDAIEERIYRMSGGG